MGNRGLAALYRALKEPTGPHLDDEALAAIIDAELAGENVSLLFTNEIEHVETCEQCALAYSNLLVTMQEVMGDMALAAEAITPVEAYAAFLQTEIQKKTGQLSLLPELVNYLAGVLARQLTTVPVGRLPVKVPTGLIRQSPFAASLTADAVKNISATIVKNTAALSTFLTGQAAVIWNKPFLVTAELVDSKYRLTLNGSTAHIGEPKIAREVGNERLLTHLAIPDSPLQLEARLFRERSLTCRLTIQLRGTKESALAGHKIQVHYHPIEKSAETDTTGTAHFNDIPIAALPELKITVER